MARAGMGRHAVFRNEVLFLVGTRYCSGTFKKESHTVQAFDAPQDVSQITTIALRLATAHDRPQVPRLHQLFQPAVADALIDHNRSGNQGQPFEYPRIQLKAVNKFAYLVGLRTGSSVLQSIWPQLDRNVIPRNDFQVQEMTLETEPLVIESRDHFQWYEFATPWVALNARNFQAYTASRSQTFRREKLNRTLIGNCLGLCKSLAVKPQGRIDVDCGKLTSMKTTSRGRRMIAFVGRFQLNLVLPNYIGLGQSAAFGWGTIRSVTS